MRQLAATLVASALFLGWPAQPRAAEPYESRSGASRALHTGLAAIANVTPVVSTLYAPRCLLGYVFCKALFAGASLVAAGDQLVMSGGGDLTQTRAILHRGFYGDWYLTARHVAGDATAVPLPDPPPPPSEGGEWQPPPL